MLVKSGRWSTNDRTCQSGRRRGWSTYAVRLGGTSAPSPVRTGRGAGTGQSCLELLDAAFDGTGANRITLFTKILVLHAALMGIEILRIFFQVGVLKRCSYVVNSAQVERLATRLVPLLRLRLIVRIQCLSGAGDMFRGTQSRADCTGWNQSTIWMLSGK